MQGIHVARVQIGFWRGAAGKAGRFVFDRASIFVIAGRNAPGMICTGGACFFICRDWTFLICGGSAVGDHGLATAGAEDQTFKKRITGEAICAMDAGVGCFSRGVESGN